jgi:Golgi transport complex subunit 5
MHDCGLRQSILACAAGRGNVSVASKQLSMLASHLCRISGRDACAGPLQFAGEYRHDRGVVSSGSTSVDSGYLTWYSAMSSNTSKTVSGVAADVLSIQGLDTSVVQPFLQADYKSSVEYASAVLQDPRGSSAARVQELSDALDKLDGVIAAEVMGKQDRLLSHVRQLHASEAAMRQISNAVTSLTGKLSGLKSDVHAPFQSLQGHEKQLGNLHSAANLLRLVTFRLKQAEKLRATLQQGMDASELAKAAKIIYETESIAPMDSVSGVEAVDRSAAPHVTATLPTCRSLPVSLQAAARLRYKHHRRQLMTPNVVAGMRSISRRGGSA